MQYTIGTLIVAIIALVLLTQGESPKRKPVKEAPAPPKTATVSRYYKVSPNVFNEADGSIAQVNAWIRQHIADPEASVQEWGQVTKVGRGYETNVVIRNKNLMGGWVASKYKFEFNTLGQVVSAYDVKEQARLSQEALDALEAELAALDQQIQHLRGRLEFEKSSLTYAQQEGRITSRGIKVENIYRILNELQWKRENVAAKLARQSW